MNEIVKYGLAAVAVIVVLINSIEIKKLNKVRAAEESGGFDAAQYAQNFWEQQRTASLEEVVDVEQLLSRLEQNFDSTVARGEKVGISDYRYFMVRGSGTIKEIQEDNIVVSLDENHSIRLATGFIFGNTVRNAVPQITIGEFVNMTQFNQVSIQINKLIQENIVPVLNKRAEVGRSVSFGGALSVDVETGKLNSFRVIPLSIDVGGEQ